MSRRGGRSRARGPWAITGNALRRQDDLAAVSIAGPRAARPARAAASGRDCRLAMSVVLRNGRGPSGAPNTRAWLGDSGSGLRPSGSPSQPMVAPEARFAGPDLREAIADAELIAPRAFPHVGAARSQAVPAPPCVVFAASEGGSHRDPEFLRSTENLPVSGPNHLRANIGTIGRA